MKKTKPPAAKASYPRMVHQFRVGKVTYASLTSYAGEVSISRVMRRILEEHLAKAGKKVG